MTDREKEYKSLASSLSQYVQTVDENAAILLNASQDCVDNTYGNSTAKEAAEKVDAAVAEIKDEMDSLKQLIQYIQTLTPDVTEEAEIPSNGEVEGTENRDDKKKNRKKNKKKNR